jgi:hypothetical protein
MVCACIAQEAAPTQAGKVALLRDEASAPGEGAGCDTATAAHTVEHFCALGGYDVHIGLGCLGVS